MTYTREWEILKLSHACPVYCLYIVDLLFIFCGWLGGRGEDKKLFIFCGRHKWMTPNASYFSFNLFLQEGSCLLSYLIDTVVR